MLAGKAKLLQRAGGQGQLKPLGAGGVRGGTNQCVRERAHECNECRTARARECASAQVRERSSVSV
eukprot:13660985-Alexandrium_andersonii.AAC.1